MKTDFDKLLLGEPPDAVIATTTRGKVLYWSKGAKPISDFDTREATEHFLRTIFAKSISRMVFTLTRIFHGLATMRPVTAMGMLLWVASARQMWQPEHKTYAR